MPDNEPLLARARKGDLSAMETLYQTYEGPVFNLGRRILSRQEEAEEVLQETFLEVFKNLKQFRGDCPLALWIRKIAVNKALARLRWKATRAEESMDEEALESHLPGDHDTGAPFSDPFGRARLEAALASLSDVSRAVVWLHDVEGYTHEEIGALMRKTASFSKSQLSRSHAHLRGELAPREEVLPCTRTATIS